MHLTKIVVVSSAAWGLRLSPLAVETRRGSTTVVIQGVLHGSSSSAEDVRQALEEWQPDVIMLELCAARWRSLATRPEESVVADMKRVWSTTRRVLRERGSRAAFSAASVGTLYAVSRVVGFDPGVEFRIPLSYAELEEVDVVLGDRDVMETLSLSGESDIVRGLSALGRAAVGWHEADLCLVLSLLRHPLRLAEFSKLLLAITLPVGSMASLFDATFLDAVPDLPVLDLFVAIAMVQILATFGAQVLDSRDDVLFRSLAASLNLAQSRRPHQQTVLVVVGALHVNGILHRLRHADDDAAAAAAAGE